MRTVAEWPSSDRPISFGGHIDIMPWISGILLLLVSQLGFSVAAAEEDVGQEIVGKLWP